MTRALVIIKNPDDRRRIAAWANSAPWGTRVEFKAPKRTLPQNDHLWALLTDLSRQVDHCGRKYTPDEWKILIMHAWGQEMQFLPALDGRTFVPVGHSSSDLSKVEMIDLIEFIYAWGAEHNIVFHRDRVAAGEPDDPEHA